MQALPLQTVGRWLRLVVPFLLLTFVVWVLSRSVGLVPPLGTFLDPFRGAWVAPDDEMASWGDRLEIPGLKGSVRVRVDADRIKHIFAENDEDLYFAQGYIVASDRLWQMEFIARLAAGRLSEVVGPKGLEMDRLFVKLGVPEAAHETVELMSHDVLTRTALEAYAAGVNAYIATLKTRDLPFEYKLLNYRPEAWTSLKSALLLKFMAYNLSFWTHDLSLTRSQSRLSAEDFQSLFPLDIDIPAPIIPKSVTWNFKSLASEPPVELHQILIDKIMPLPTPHPSNGSNNWAVMGKKSTTGRPIVSNDVHLGYSLPSLWYQIQLHSPEQNVYGVTLPGSPGVILGFNSNIAWAVTNGGTDIVDWYDLRFHDDQRYEYLHDGQWRPVISQDHWIHVRNEPSVKVTLRKTHYGPIVYDDNESPLNPMIPRGLAMRWAALDPSNELRTFLLLNRAADFQDCRNAIEEYSSPDQNFICADQAGDVGIFHEGLYPIRWKGQGRLISDGSDPAYDWHGWIPRAEVPLVINPERGFVSSANQAPTDSQYPHYLGWPFEVPYRGMRINEILSSKDKFSPQEIVAMQEDKELIPARELLPTLLKTLPRADLGDTEKSALAVLEKWNYVTDAEAAGPLIFEEWWSRLQTAIWSDHFPDPKLFFVPRPHQTARLILEDPESKWFDRIETDERETLSRLLRQSFEETIADLIDETDEEDPAKWHWSEERPARFPHLARIPGLGGQPVQAGGHAHAIFANRGDHGPVWKSVVALGPEPQAWGIYPGGQSGHPGSRFYDNFVADWSQGRLRELHFLKNVMAPLKTQFKEIQLQAPAVLSEESRL